MADAIAVPLIAGCGGGEEAVAAAVSVAASADGADLDFGSIGLPVAAAITARAASVAAFISPAVNDFFPVGSAAVRDAFTASNAAVEAAAAEAVVLVAVDGSAFPSDFVASETVLLSAGVDLVSVDFVSTDFVSADFDFGSGEVFASASGVGWCCADNCLVASSAATAATPLACSTISSRIQLDTATTPPSR